jgi:hypothetical protein
MPFFFFFALSLYMLSPELKNLMEKVDEHVVKQAVLRAIRSCSGSGGDHHDDDDDDDDE